MAYASNIDGYELEPMTPTETNRGGIYAESVEDTEGMTEVVVGKDGKAYVDVSAKENKTTIITNSTDVTATITLANNTEYRFTQDLSSLTLTLPQTIDTTFIVGVVFSSGSTATAMTYDGLIKWSGDDVTSGSFVPQADKMYNIVLWYDGINVNAVVRGV